MQHYILDEDINTLITVTGQQIREYDNIFLDMELYQLFDMAPYKKDFLRQMVSRRSKEQIEMLQKKILLHAKHVKGLMGRDQIMILFGCYETYNILYNEMSYIKYCKVNDRELIDLYPSFQQYYKNKNKGYEGAI